MTLVSTHWINKYNLTYFQGYGLHCVTLGIPLSVIQIYCNSLFPFNVYLVSRILPLDIEQMFSY
jgi:hypothetical protein